MRYVLPFEAVDRTRVADVGGKGAHLGELSRIDGVSVPPGFCVTTDAFSGFMAEIPSIEARLDHLSRLDPDDHEAIRATGDAIRRALEQTAIPVDIAAAITARLALLGDAAFAVRSSATAEDLPTASFAGQHDSFLDVVGPAAVLEHVRRCWASLFTERAVSYRLRHGFDARTIRMGVVVQRMVSARAAGVLFTADPVNGHRRVACVEAVPGLAEALVSGLARPDVHRMRGGEVVSTTVGGGRDLAVLTDAEVVRLVTLGRRIEARFGQPQDIEWCLDDAGFHVVQSRPITTLFPIPAADDADNHVYISVGHQQMMTDAMKPLGLSLWKLTAARPMVDAGGRLFVDVTGALGSPGSRAGLLGMAGRSDPLIGDALKSIVARGDFVPSLPDPPATSSVPPSPVAAPVDAAVVAELVAANRASVDVLRREIADKSGVALLDFILRDIEELKRVLFDPRSYPAILAGMQAAWWLNDHLGAWLGEKNPADLLARSVPGNVTSEMGLALLDVADVLRSHPAVVSFLETVDGDGFLDALATVPGGNEVAVALRGWLDRYGMRGVGEIDVTRPRWAEHPSALVPVLLGHVRHAEPGDGARRFEQGQREALAKARDILDRLRALPDGEQKAEEAGRAIDRLRAFAGYREYPKYGMVTRYFLYKQALLAEAGRLVGAGVLRATDDIFFLTFDELHAVVRSGRADGDLIRRRRDAFAWHETLTPPRVLTSDGEAVAGAYRREVPAGALVGLAVSAGTVEGRARVIIDVARADLEPGDILVTPFTDPSWTPLFIAIAGLVTEVGGLMTHGAVIAREYGLPAVVGVERATRRIRDGQRIRVHGTEGYVELLS